MAGRDATRFLAKNRLEEESEEELMGDLNVGERANLEVCVVFFIVIGFVLFCFVF